MQEERIWQKYTRLTSSILLTATVLVAPSFAADTNKTQIQGEYLLAQVPDSCRQVIARNGLNVRRQPTANSEAIGIIDSARNVTIQSLGENGRRVRIESLGTDGWVPITVLVRGYVQTENLAYCS
jgi:uncharacterized protein YgiM (DUF1202 family)